MPEDCEHDLHFWKSRGGRTKWWTCINCGSRWPRYQDEELAVEEGNTREMLAYNRVKAELERKGGDGWETVSASQERR